MKKIPWMTIILAIAIIASLLLSYFLIFDAIPFYQLFMDTEVEETTQVVGEDNYTSDFYDNKTRTNLATTLYPTQVIINETENVYLIHDPDLIASLISQLRANQLIVTQNTVIEDVDAYYQVINENHMQFVFANDFPVVTMDHYLDIQENQQPAYTFNRIILPLGDSGKAYLVNSYDQSYLEVETPESLANNMHGNAQNSRDAWLQADRFPIADEDFVYLPLNTVTLDAEEYLLQLIPETIYTDLVFRNHNTRFIRLSPSSSQTVSTYQSLDTILSFDTVTQTINIEYTTPEAEARLNFDQRIRLSLDLVSDYDFWEEGIRYASQQGNMIVFRRYLNGLPVYYQNRTTPYGSTRIYLENGSNDLSTSSVVARLETSAVRLLAKIDDQSEAVELETANEIYDMLTEQGLSFLNFSNVTLGYQWMPEMENMTKVNFTPTWFFNYEGTYYSFNQISNGIINQLLEDEANQESEETDTTGLDAQDPVAMFGADNSTVTAHARRQGGQ
ncbi:two-component system activity regulator YycH [Fundicoccus culcitae]|uniref:Two-component system activity regulator YycH n=1 Tax=Fundicoccus culcitae TaxID=2969821 RepID=A0ABY5P3D0_9LACT|nr:two-component system activity regulator YycH [Fundicoccus culcitae]UUX33236.1 two-component system activity regulator YycH [Fundicoccus culcitae]